MNRYIGLTDTGGGGGETGVMVAPLRPRRVSRLGAITYKHNRVQCNMMGETAVETGVSLMHAAPSTTTQAEWNSELYCTPTRGPLAAGRPVRA